MLARSAIQSAFIKVRSEATNGCRHSDLAFQELLQDGKRSESCARSHYTCCFANAPNPTRMGFTKFYPPLLSPPPRGASFLPRKPLSSWSPTESLAKLSRTYRRKHKVLSDVVLEHTLLLELLQSVVRSGHVVLVGADDTGKDLKESCSCFRGKQSKLLVDIWVTVCNCCLVLLEIIIVM
jgi:hypothetical protein